MALLPVYFDCHLEGPFFCFNAKNKHSLVRGVLVGRLVLKMQLPVFVILEILYHFPKVWYTRIRASLGWLPNMWSIGRCNAYVYFLYTFLYGCAYQAR